MGHKKDKASPRKGLLVPRGRVVWKSSWALDLSHKNFPYWWERRGECSGIYPRAHAFSFSLRCPGDPLLPQSPVALLFPTVPPPSSFPHLTCQEHSSLPGSELSKATSQHCGLEPSENAFLCLSSSVIVTFKSKKKGKEGGREGGKKKRS